MDNQQESSFIMGYVIGLIDGEGNFSMYKHNQQNVLVPRLIISNTDINMILMLKDYFNRLGIPCYIQTQNKLKDGYKDLHRLCIAGMKRMKRLVDMLIQYPIAKIEQVKILKEFIDFRLNRTEYHQPYTDYEYSLRNKLFALIDNGRNPQRLYASLQKNGDDIVHSDNESIG